MITLKSENGRYIVTIGSEKKEFNTWNAANKYIEYIGANRSFGEKSMWEQMSELKARIANRSNMIDTEAFLDLYDYSGHNFKFKYPSVEEVVEYEKRRAWKKINSIKKIKNKVRNLKEVFLPPKNVQEQILALEKQVLAFEERANYIEEALSDMYFYFDYDNGGIRVERTLKEIREFEKDVELKKRFGSNYRWSPEGVNVSELEEKASKIEYLDFDEKDIQNIILDLKEQIFSAEARFNCYEEAWCDLFYYFEHDENNVATTAKEIIEIIESERIIVGRKTK